MVHSAITIESTPSPEMVVGVSRKSIRNIPSMRSFLYQKDVEVTCRKAFSFFVSLSLSFPCPASTQILPALSTRSLLFSRLKVIHQAKCTHLHSSSHSYKSISMLRVWHSKQSLNSVEFSNFSLKETQ